MNLIIDIGNSCAKLVAFDGDKMVDEMRTSNTTLKDLASFVKRHAFKKGMVSSVIHLTEDAQSQLDACGVPLCYFNYLTPMPIHIRYATPQTLGTDRIASVIGAQSLFPNRNILVIDAGTAITYEWLDAEGNYWGGNISPGVRLRLQALHEFTGKLPLIDKRGEVPPIGYNTETAIRAGVVNGVIKEIEGYIEEYRKKSPDLLIFLTGGEDLNLGTKIKSGIFAEKYLVPRGLNRILSLNEDLQ